MPGPVLIGAESLSRAIGATRLFDALSLSLYEGDVVGLVGPNGSGKTTLLRILAGLDEPSWTILLEVYRAEITGRRLSVSKLCALDEASQTTAWRRIRAMEDAGLLVRDQDPADARRSFVTLTEPAVHAVADFMARADGLLAKAS